CLLHRQCLCVLMGRPPPTSPVFPYTTLFRSRCARVVLHWRVYTGAVRRSGGVPRSGGPRPRDATSGARIPSCVGRCAVRATELRSEEHTSELQSRENLVCRLLLEKRNLSVML